MLCPQCSNRKRVVDCPNTGGVNFDYLVKVVYPSLSTVKVHFSPSYIISNLWGDNFEKMYVDYLFPNRCNAIVLVLLDDSCLNQ